jgi:hypothetical protein
VLSVVRQRPAHPAAQTEPLPEAHQDGEAQFVGFSPHASRIERTGTRSKRRGERRLNLRAPLPLRCTSCAVRTSASARDRATVRRSRSHGGGAASTTPRATARRWHACCRASSAARLGIAVDCSCRGEYLRQQCHGKFRPVRATGHVPYQGEGRLAVGTREGEARSPPTGA